MNGIQLEARNPAAKGKALRRAGIAPCVIFGPSLPASISAQLRQSTAQQLVRTLREGSKVTLQLEGKELAAQIKDISRDFATGDIIHISFQILESGKKVNSKATILLQNKDKVMGTLDQLLFEVPYTSLPKDMVDTVPIDLEGVAIGTTLTVGDIPAFQSEALELQVETDSVILRIKDKKLLAATPAAGDE